MSSVIFKPLIHGTLMNSFFVNQVYVKFVSSPFCKLVISRGHYERTIRKLVKPEGLDQYIGKDYICRDVYLTPFDNESILDAILNSMTVSKDLNEKKLKDNIKLEFETNRMIINTLSGVLHRIRKAVGDVSIFYYPFSCLSIPDNVYIRSCYIDRGLGFDEYGSEDLIEKFYGARSYKAPIFTKGGKFYISTAILDTDVGKGPFIEIKKNEKGEWFIVNSPKDIQDKPIDIAISEYRTRFPDRGLTTILRETLEGETIEFDVGRNYSSLPHIGKSSKIFLDLPFTQIKNTIVSKFPFITEPKITKTESGRTLDKPLTDEFYIIPNYRICLMIYLFAWHRIGDPKKYINEYKTKCEKMLKIKMKTDYSEDIDSLIESREEYYKKSIETCNILLNTQKTISFSIFVNNQEIKF